MAETITMTTTIEEEETRLGIDPPSSYFYGSGGFDDHDDDDDDDDDNDYLDKACRVLTAALKEGHDDVEQEQEHPWDEDCDIPLRLAAAPRRTVSSLQIKGFAASTENIRENHASQDTTSPTENESQDYGGGDDESSDCPTIKQGNRQGLEAASSINKPATTGGAPQQESPNKDGESDGEESNDTATTEEDDEHDNSSSSSSSQEEKEEQNLQKDHHCPVLGGGVVVKKKERTNSWFRSWWNKDSRNQQERPDGDEEEDDDDAIKAPAAIVLDDTDHDGFAIDSALAMPAFVDDRHHPFHQHQSFLSLLELDEDLEYHQQQEHFLLNFEMASDDCSEDMDMTLIEIIDSDDSQEMEVEVEQHDLGIDSSSSSNNNNNNSIDNAAAACTSPPLPSPTTKPLVALPKSALKKTNHQATSRSNNKRRVSFHIPAPHAAANTTTTATSTADASTTTTSTAATVDLDPVVVNLVDTIPPLTTAPKWKLRQQWKRRQASHTITNAHFRPKEAPIVVNKGAKKKNEQEEQEEDDGDLFNSRSMKLLRRFRNRSAAVKLLQDK